MVSGLAAGKGVRAQGQTTKSGLRLPFGTELSQGWYTLNARKFKSSSEALRLGNPVKPESHHVFLHKAALPRVYCRADKGLP